MRAVERQQSAAATCPSHRATEARLGRQSQAWIRKNRAVTLSTRLKGEPALSSRNARSDELPSGIVPAVMLAMPDKHFVPSLGENVWAA